MERKNLSLGIITKNKDLNQWKFVIDHNLWDLVVQTENTLTEEIIFYNVNIDEFRNSLRFTNTLRQRVLPL